PVEVDDRLAVLVQARDRRLPRPAERVHLGRVLGEERLADEELVRGARSAGRGAEAQSHARAEQARIGIRHRARAPARQIAIEERQRLPESHEVQLGKAHRAELLAVGTLDVELRPRRPRVARHDLDDDGIALAARLDAPGLEEIERAQVARALTAARVPPWIAGLEQQLLA